MARKTGNTPWHAAAIQLQADGKSATEVFEDLKGTEGGPVTLAAVKKFLSRARRNPGKALSTVTSRRGFVAERPELSPDDNRTLVDLMLVVERSRATTLGKAFAAVDVVLDATSKKPPTELQYAQAKFAIELIKAAKAPAGTIQLPDGAIGGGSDPEKKEIRLEVVRVTRDNASPGS